MSISKVPYVYNRQELADLKHMAHRLIPFWPGSSGWKIVFTAMQQEHGVVEVPQGLIDAASDIANLPQYMVNTLVQSEALIEMHEQDMIHSVVPRQVLVIPPISYYKEGKVEIRLADDPVTGKPNEYFYVSPATLGKHQLNATVLRQDLHAPIPWVEVEFENGIKRCIPYTSYAVREVIT